MIREKRKIKKTTFVLDPLKFNFNTAAKYHQKYK